MVTGIQVSKSRRWCGGGTGVKEEGTATRRWMVTSLVIRCVPEGLKT